jgi:hypothetical protein
MTVTTSWTWIEEAVNNKLLSEGLWIQNKRTGQYNHLPFEIDPDIRQHSRTDPIRNSWITTAAVCPIQKPWIPRTLIFIGAFEIIFLAFCGRWLYPPTLKEIGKNNESGIFFKQRRTSRGKGNRKKGGRARKLEISCLK